MLAAMFELFEIIAICSFICGCWYVPAWMYLSRHEVAFLPCHYIACAVAVLFGIIGLMWLSW